MTGTGAIYYGKAEGCEPYRSASCAPRVWKLSVLIQLEAVRDCNHNLMETEVAHGGKQDTANERARAGTHERALTCGCCSEGKEGKEGRERDRGIGCVSN